MALFLVSDGKNTLVQVPENTEETLKRVEKIYNGKIVILCPNNCWESGCPCHSQTPGCGKGEELLDKYQRENN